MSEQSNPILDLNKTYFLGFLLAISAGIVWSFGAPTVRHMIDAEIYQWHYLFVRGVVVAIILLFFLMAKEGPKFVNNFSKVGISGLIGGTGLACAFIGFIFGMTNTSAATTLFLIALQPLFAGLLAYLFLKEKLRSATLIAMIISIFGISLMVYNDWMIGALFGLFAGFICSLGFSVFAVSLRWRPETPKFTTIIIAGLICAIFSLMMVIFFSDHTTMPLKNILLSILHGSFVATGLILISYGSKYLPAAELMLLATMETVGGILWCWLPIFGVNEVPGTNTLIGGIVIIFAITFHAIGTRQKIIPPTL